MCVCVCVCARGAHQNTLSFGPHPVDKIHTKYVKMAGLENIHLNTVLCLKWMRTVVRKSDVCQYIVLK